MTFSSSTLVRYYDRPLKFTYLFSSISWTNPIRVMPATTFVTVGHTLLVTVDRSNIVCWYGVVIHCIRKSIAQSENFAVWGTACTTSQIPTYLSYSLA